MGRRRERSEASEWKYRLIYLPSLVYHAYQEQVILRQLIMHNWADGEVQSTYPLGDYKSKFGTDYNNFHRIDIHKQLIKSAFEEPGEGPACVLEVNHKAIDLNAEEGTIRFENGSQTSADLIVAADGIRVSDHYLDQSYPETNETNLHLVASKRAHWYYA